MGGASLGVGGEVGFFGEKREDVEPLLDAALIVVAGENLRRGEGLVGGRGTVGDKRGLA